MVLLPFLLQAYSIALTPVDCRTVQYDTQATETPQAGETQEQAPGTASRLVCQSGISPIFLALIVAVKVLYSTVRSTVQYCA